VFRHYLPFWTYTAPLFGWIVLAGSFAGWNSGGWFAAVVAFALGSAVLSAVHHAEVIAHRVGEPYGTLTLALAVTAIEVALIVSLRASGGDAAAALARDTIFAALMIILTGMLGMCLMIGGLRHREQSFDTRGVSSTLAVLAALAVLTMVLPNYTTSVAGPYYSDGQLITVAIVSAILYGIFVLVQTVRHRDYFLPKGPEVADETVHAPKPPPLVAAVSFALLLVCLGAVVLLAKALQPTLESAVAAIHAPNAIVGVAIALLVLLPEGVAAGRAARANRLQTSLNLALGSALASIALTIPTVAVISLWQGWSLMLGLDSRGTVLLALSLLVATLSLSTGRTTVLQGAVHLVIFAMFLFTTLVP
jgi:Ca2+:H+ antiporter